MTTTAVTFDLTSSNYSAPLGFELRLDDQVLVNYDHVSEATSISVDITDDEGEHEFTFVLKNKTSSMTQVDDDGNITSDSMLTIANLAFDGIKLGHGFVELSKYYHDGNGSHDTIEDKFYGDMGCNGYVSLRFTTPIYLWLLEFM